MIGFIGAALILIGFLLAEFSKYGPESKEYNYINLVGALILIYYAKSINSIPFIILNSIWFLSAFYKLFFKRE